MATNHPTINIKKSLFVPKFYPHLFNYDNRFEVYMGSAGSAKSYFITQKIILKALASKRKVLVTRRYGTTLRNSVFALFKDVLTSFKLLPLCKVRETDFYIRLPNGSEIIFLGLDSEEKLLSIAGITDIFIEEAYEVPKDLFEQLNLRMRSKAPNQQIFIAFNPISTQNHLYEFCEVNPPENLLYIKSTYRDNPFLPEAYVKTLEDMKTRNPNKYRIFGLGEWGSDPEGLVFSNWSTAKLDIPTLAHLEHRVGMDLGFVDPTTIVATLYDKTNKTIYIYKEYYKRGAQLDVVAEEMYLMNLNKVKVYCDSAEPRSIAFFKSKGLNVDKANKGGRVSSVELGISFIQNHTLVVSEDCAEVIRELENYTYLKDKQTGKYTNKTDHDFSHTMDALRYAYSDIYVNNKAGSISKAGLGL